MEISNQDKKLMISTLGTLRFNSYNDLVQNIKNAQKELLPELFNLMVNGDTQMYNGDTQMYNGDTQMYNGDTQMYNGENQIIENKDKYNKIKLLDGRWSLKTIIFYHYNRVKNITEEQFNEINQYLG